MNLLEAAKLVAALSMLDPFAKKRTEDEQMVIAEVIANALPKADLPWAMEQVNAGMRRGTVPTLPDLVAAWQEEANRRVDSVPVPEAPPEIENNPVRWQEWERARRDALIAGKSQNAAIAAADRQLGVSSVRAQIEAPRTAPPGESSAKERVFAALREWDRQQKLAQYEAEHPDEAEQAGEQR